MKEENRITHCPSCNNSDFRMLYHSFDRLLGIDGVFGFYECKNCSLQFLSPQHSYNSLSKYYSDDYKPYNRSTDDWKDKPELFIYKGLNSRGIIKKLFIPFNFFIRRAMIVKKGEKLLDIGCGSGNYLRMAKKLGVECFGSDIYSGKKGEFKSDDIKFFNKKAEELDFSDNFFDVITLNHVFEHLKDPHIILEKIRKFIKPEGIIILQVPNNRSLSSVIFRRFYQGIDSPRHYFVYNKKSMENICDSRNLKIKKIFYRSPVTSNIIAFSFIYLLESIFNKSRPSKIIRKVFGNIVFRLVLFPFSILICIVRLGDGIEFIIKKKTKDV